MNFGGRCCLVAALNVAVDIEELGKNAAAAMGEVKAREPKTRIMLTIRSSRAARTKLFRGLAAWADPANQSQASRCSSCLLGH